MSERLGQVAKHVSGESAINSTGLLSGQVAIITGAGQGIGAACAVIFAKEGAKVVVSDIDESQCNHYTETRSS